MLCFVETQFVAPIDKCESILKTFETPPCENEADFFVWRDLKISVIFAAVRTY